MSPQQKVANAVRRISLFACILGPIYSTSCAIAPAPVIPQSGEAVVWALHAPPIVPAGKPIEVYIDFDDPCGERTAEELQASISTARSATIKLIQSIVDPLPPNVLMVCPAAFSPRRLTATLTFGSVGEASIEYLSATTRKKAYATTQVVNTEQEIPSWSPPPIR